MTVTVSSLLSAAQELLPGANLQFSALSRWKEGVAGTVGQLAGKGGAGPCALVRLCDRAAGIFHSYPLPSLGRQFGHPSGLLPKFHPPGIWPGHMARPVRSGPFLSLDLDIHQNSIQQRDLSLFSCFLVPASWCLGGTTNSLKESKLSPLPLHFSLPSARASPAHDCRVLRQHNTRMSPLTALS